MARRCMRASENRNHALLQLGELEERVLEAAESAPSGDGAFEQVGRSAIGHAGDEVLHIAVPLAGRKRVDAPGVVALDGIELAIVVFEISPAPDLATRGVDPPASFG